jgi:cytidine deaminase
VLKDKSDQNPTLSISIVAVRTDGVGRYYILPLCGKCRDVINDLNGDAWVIVGTLKDSRKSRISELLP